MVCVSFKVDPCKKQGHICLSLSRPSELSTVFKSNATEEYTGKLSSSYKTNRNAPQLPINQSVEHKKKVKINERCVQKVCRYIRWTEAGLQTEWG